MPGSGSQARLTPDEKARSLTPRPWPENARPTEGQLADWLARCTHAERLAFVQNARHNQDASHRCFVDDHERAVESYRRVCEELRDRQDRALSLLLSFDPTSGTARTQAFVSDLRNLWDRGYDDE